MSSLHHDRLPEEDAAPAETATPSLAPVRSTSGDVEEKAPSTVPPQREGKAQASEVRRATDPAAGTLAARAEASRTGKAAGARAVRVTVATARATIARKAATEVAADPAPVRRRPTPYKRSAVDLTALAPVTDIAALVDAPLAAPAAVVVVKDAPAALAGAGGRRGLLARRPPSGRRRSPLYLAAVLVGALGVSGASVGEPAAVETHPVSHSVSVAEQLGIEGSASAEVVDAEDTSLLREMVVSRNARDAERAAAADAQAEADRLATEEAARAAAEAARPKAVLPVPGGRLTSGFGPRWGTLHAGIDLAAPMRTPEYAAMDGVVLEAGAASGYGLAVYIQHGNGDVTVYGHMDEILVEPGQIVRAGDTIALLGNRGQSTGPHLHFEVHVGGIDGQRIDPLPWLRERGVAI
ncbi:peptidoglycan DD-metalloendopeptidase family protein [Blastococcus sp. HT6-30]|uniref:M23 family metallopeptidase n=1 Tax=Blastococcus sp. HT6-30 TaxID=3144843 RepID=UPI00321AAA72